MNYHNVKKGMVLNSTLCLIALFNKNIQGVGIRSIPILEMVGAY
jgi:hypothetical protein